MEVWGKRYRVSGSSFWVNVVFQYYDLTWVLPSSVSVLFLILFTSISPPVSLFLATTCCLYSRWHPFQTKHEQDQSTCFSPLALKQEPLEGFYRFSPQVMIRKPLGGKVIPFFLFVLYFPPRTCKERSGLHTYVNDETCTQRAIVRVLTSHRV